MEDGADVEADTHQHVERVAIDQPVPGRAMTERFLVPGTHAWRGGPVAAHGISGVGADGGQGVAAVIAAHGFGALAEDLCDVPDVGRGCTNVPGFAARPVRGGFAVDLLHERRDNHGTRLANGFDGAVDDGVGAALYVAEALEGTVKQKRVAFLKAEVGEAFR